MCDSATPLFSVTGLSKSKKTWVNQLVSWNLIANCLPNARYRSAGKTIKNS